MIDDAVRIEDRPRIRQRDEVAAVAMGAYELLFEQLDRLEPGDWEVTTECEPWTVRDIVAHLVGAAHGHASIREGLRQALWGLRHRSEYDGSELDAMNDLQVREHRAKSPAALAEELRRTAPRAVRTRANLPALIGRLPIPNSPDGNAAEGMPERTTLGELNRVIYTRDAFMHRIDIARAVGHDLVLDPNVDGRIVEDVVIEWCERHGEPVVVSLAGPAGGRFVAGNGQGERIEMDAIEFCRALSGRVPASGLLRHRILF
ncbi:MAG: maleylpyruvate isomerase family mycothiol-dependent enzyme [Nitriliruptorales bacterium]|nr:maleylpyruvate isomerase family mycothiol-dependent enzyme [Nitriliruptorales bacterium]